MFADVNKLLLSAGLVVAATTGTAVDDAFGFAIESQSSLSMWPRRSTMEEPEPPKRPGGLTKVAAGTSAEADCAAGASKLRM